MDLESESKLFSLIAQSLPRREETTNADTYEISDSDSDTESDGMTHIVPIISLINSMDLKSQPKPESELMSLVTQAISVFNSMDLESQPKPMSEFISLIAKKLSLVESDVEKKWDSELKSLLGETVNLEPEPEFVSLVYQILSLVMYINSKCEELISISPQVQVELKEGKLHVTETVPWRSTDKWCCLFKSWKRIRFTGEEATHFRCEHCNGHNHKGYGKVPVEIKHTLHPQHPLQLVLLKKYTHTRKCHCCDKNLRVIFYYCSACDFAINFACVENPPVLTIDRTKWHEHPLVIFPRKASLTCNLCALDDSTSGHFYMCPPCDFVVHQSCLSLPRLIKISRHPQHRISFTSSFDRGEWSCAICRKKIDHVYGGYSCIKDGCSYVAHSKCATQSNVWDGIELEGVPEEIEEELEPFVRISGGVIQHFSHQQHHLKLDENTCRDYDDNKQCQACMRPIYSGNFYSCMECDFILHETCANISRKIYHPIHPHQLTLIVEYDSDTIALELCSACPVFCTPGFFYECGKEGCCFKLHVECATIYEPLVDGRHMHPLFLTSKPGEQRLCLVCKWQHDNYKETFNCIECDYVLCFGCAILPQKVRYKHDTHMLSLSYGEETGSTMKYWCEVCESNIDPEIQFYFCDEYCGVTLHVRCLIGENMTPGSYLLKLDKKVTDTQVSVVAMRNNHTCRPICSSCEERCRHKIVLQYSGLIFCGFYCLYCSAYASDKGEQIARP